MPRKKLIGGDPSNADKIKQFKEGDTIFTRLYGRCIVDYIEKSRKDALVAKDNNGKLHMVSIKDIILED